MSKPMNASERRHIGWIKSQRCILCEILGQPQSGDTDAHHIRLGQGGGQRAPHWLTLPLCHNGCHQGPNGIHGDRSRFRLAKVDELDLLACIIARLAELQGVSPAWIEDF